MQTQGVKIKRKKNNWITIDYMTDYAIKEYRLRNNKSYE